MKDTSISKNLCLLNEKEKKLIDIIRLIEHGELKVVIQDRRPVRVEQLRKSIKL